MKNEDKLQQVSSYLRVSNDYTYRNSLLQYLKNKNNYNYMSIFDRDTLADILRIIIDCNVECMNGINIAERLYNVIVYDKKDKEQYELFLKFFRLSQTTSWNNSKNEFFLKVYPMFENKKLVLGIFTELKNIKINDFTFIYDYILYARRYYVDENAFYSSVLSSLYKINRGNGYHLFHQDEVFKEQLEKDKQLAGIYDIDENKINNLLERFFIATSKQEKLDQSIEDTNKKLDELNLNFDIKLNQSDEMLNQKIESSKLLVENYSNKIDEILKQKDNNINDSLIELQNYSKELKNMMDEFKEKLQNYDKKIKEKEKSTKIKSKTTSKILENNAVSILNKIKKQIDKYDKIDYDPNIDIIVKEEIMNFIADRKINDSKFRLQNNEERFFLLYYFSLHNNSEDIFKKLCLEIDTDYIQLAYLDKDLIKYFDRTKYVDYIVSHNRELDYILENLKFNQVEEILDKNPEFQITPYSLCIKNAINVFGIDEIFVKQNQNLLQSLTKYYYEDYKIIKKIYDIDPNFIIHNRCILKITDVFSCKEITEFTNEQQDKIEKIYDGRYPNDDNDIEIIRKLIYYPEKIYLDAKIVVFIKKYGDIDTYLKFNYDDAKKWYKLCEESYCYDNSYKYLHELKKETKRLIKKYKLKEKYPHRGDIEN